MIKSAIDVMIGPAGDLNKISSTATSNVDEVGLVVSTYTYAVRCSWALLMLSLAWLTKSEAAAAVISERARDSEYALIS